MPTERRCSAAHARSGSASRRIGSGPSRATTPVDLVGREQVARRRADQVDRTLVADDAGSATVSRGGGGGRSWTRNLAEQAEVDVDEAVALVAVEQVLAPGLGALEHRAVELRGRGGEPARGRADRDRLAGEPRRVVAGEAVDGVALGHGVLLVGRGSVRPTAGARTGRPPPRAAPRRPRSTSPSPLHLAAPRRPPPSPRRPVTGRLRPVHGVALLFLANGLAHPSLWPRLPEIAEGVGATPATFGLALLGTGVGGISGRCSPHGSRGCGGCGAGRRSSARRADARRSRPSGWPRRCRPCSRRSRCSG